MEGDNDSCADIDVDTVVEGDNDSLDDCELELVCETVGDEEYDLTADVVCIFVILDREEEDGFSEYEIDAVLVKMTCELVAVCE